MQIGFDAKRIYENKTGLGNYSRGIIEGLCQFAPQHQYHLFAPKKTTLFDEKKYAQIVLHLPKTFIQKKIKAYWRSKAVVHDIQQNKIDIFHGLSAELPFGIEKINVKTCVSIHDLIFEHYPNQYNKMDVYISRYKTKYACKIADKIIAISEQTKKDLIELYHVEESKIEVCYQSCDERFLEKKSEEDLLQIKKKYDSPDTFFLYVGSIIERKGLQKICEAILLLEEKTSLVVIGNEQSDYAKKVKLFIAENNLQTSIIFLNEQAKKNNIQEISTDDLVSIYQNAKALIYPSLYEGFGIPILEAMSCGLPVITSNISSMSEVGGDAALYINPLDTRDLANKMNQILNDKSLCEILKEKGLKRAQYFTKQHVAISMSKIYSMLGA